MSVYGNNILIEYSGKPENNEEYKKLLEELDEMFKFYVDILDLVGKHIMKCSKIKVKDEASFRKALNDLYKDADKTNKEFADLYKDMEEMPTYRRFDALSKKFSVKYSNITMEDKKKYSVIFIDRLHDLVKIADQFDSKWINDLNATLPTLRSIDAVYTDKYIQHTQLWYDAFYNEFQRTSQNMRYCIFKLDTKRENTLRYQLVQKIFKD
jgi:hypothetical protein